MARPLLILLAGLVIAAIAAVLVNLPRPPPQPPAPTPEAAAPPPAPPAPGPVTPSFDVVRIVPGRGGVLAGRAAPNAIVAILDAGAELGRTTADRRGDWVLVLDKPLPPGARELSLAAETAEGVRLAGTAPVLMVVPYPGEDTQPTLAVRTGPDGTQILQGPAADREAESLSIDSVTQLAGEGVYLAGRGPVGARLQVYLNDVLVGSPLAEGDGRWRLAARLTIPPGMHRLRLDRMAVDGSVGASAEVALETGGAVAIPLDQPGRPVVVRTGDGRWRIERPGPDGSSTTVYEPR